MRRNGGSAPIRAWIISGVLVALGAGLLCVRIASPTSPEGRAAYLLVTGGASLAALRGARRRTGGSTVGTLIAMGVGLSFVADAIYEAVTTLEGVAPEASIADFAWMASYVALAGALLALLRGAGRRIDLDGCIDIAAVFVVTMLLQWELALRALMADTSVPWPVRLMWAIYPTLDAVLLALLVRVAIAGQVRGWAAVLLAAGAGCWLFADYGYTLPAAAGPLSLWLDAGWMVGAMLLGAAPWALSTRPAAPQAELDEPVGYGRLAIAIAPLPVPAILTATAVLRGGSRDRVDSMVLLGATVALLAVATLRAVRILRLAAHARARLRSQERYASALAANSSDAVAILDADGVIRNDSADLADLAGRGGVSTAGRPFLRFVDEVDAGTATAVFDRCLLEPGQPVEAEVRIRHEDGPTVWVAARLINLLDDPDVGGVVVNLHDVTARKRAEEELTRLAFHDVLTGLANRALFTNRVAHALGRTPRTGRDAAVIFLDLDGFKAVNDTLGHPAGDELLQVIAGRLLSAVREGDTVARLGGDEFAILLEESFRAVEDATLVAERALAAVSEPIGLGDRNVTVTGSLGIAVTDALATASSLLRDADAAMYQAKAAGKARWVVFDPALQAAALERMELESDLVGAIERDELRLVFQPVVALEHEDVVGFEALVRWQHPRLGLIMPDRFIPLAETNGLIVPLDRWVLREACRTAAEWSRDFPEAGDFQVSVNISGRHVVESDLAVDAAEALAPSGLDPSRLVIEVTETALVDDIEIAAERLEEVRRLGIRVAIDDFGTGYSSLAYLRRLPVDIIKIDRSFISAIEGGEMPAMVKGLLDLGRTLDLVTVAEGVELASQRDLLREVRCRYAQGYLFAKPMEPREIELLLLQQAAMADRR